MQAEIQKLIDNPDLIAKELRTAELDVIIKELTGLNLEMRYTVRQGRNNALFEAECTTDLMGMCGIFAKLLSTCKLDTFNSCLTYTAENGFKVWFTLNLRYEHFAGGQNGMPLATFWFENGKWVVYGYKGA